MRPQAALAVLALLPAAAAVAQPTLDGRIAFRADHLSSTTPTIFDGDIIPFEGFEGFPPTIRFSVLVGGFNAQGFDNQGLFSWAGAVTASGGGLSLGNSPGVRIPFAFSPAGNGAISFDGAAITGIDAVRNPFTSTPWPMGEAPPEPAPLPHGNDEYYSVFRFTLTLEDITIRPIHIDASGLLTAIAGWTFNGGEEGGSANWVAGPFVAAPVSAGFTIIPAPASLPVLALAGLAATRRRRTV